jgi:Fe-S oxidoreductase
VKLDIRYFYAQGNLAFTLMKHVFMRVHTIVTGKKPKPGYAQFMENYGPDGVAPFTPTLRVGYPTFSACINCGLCNFHCDMLRHLPDAAFPGPRYVSTVMRDVNSISAARGIIHNCTRCGECTRRCPAGVPLQGMLRFARVGVASASPHAEAFEAIGRALEASGNVYARPHVPTDATAEPKRTKKGDVATAVLYLGCVANERGRDRAEAARRILEKRGIEFQYIDESCCGGLSGTLGIGDRGAMAKNIERIRACGARQVITVCPQCRQYFLEAVKSGVAKGITVSFILDYLTAENVKPASVGAKAYVHVPCYLRDGYFYRGHLKALVRALGHDPVIPALPPQVCCGAGGGLVKTDTDCAARMGRALVADAARAGAAMIMTECPSCVHHIGRSGDLPVKNISELAQDKLA